MESRGDEVPEQVAILLSHSLLLFLFLVSCWDSKNREAHHCLQRHPLTAFPSCPHSETWTHPVSLGLQCSLRAPAPAPPSSSCLSHCALLIGSSETRLCWTQAGCGGGSPIKGSAGLPVPRLTPSALEAKLPSGFCHSTVRMVASCLPLICPAGAPWGPATPQL